MPQLVAELFSIPWGHHRYIIDKCKSVDKALFFVRKTHENNWSRDVLLNFISTDLYEPEGKAINNFELALPDTNKDLDENTSVGFSDESTNHRPSKYYNLDVILSVGYRVNSKRGIAFRRWANKILKIERHVFNLKIKDRVIDNSLILKNIDLFLK